MDRVPLCRVSEVSEHGLKQCETAAGDKICVINAGDRFFACQAFCPHEGIALCEGVFDGEVLTCLEHLWQWSRAGSLKRRWRCTTSRSRATRYS